MRLNRKLIALSTVLALVVTTSAFAETEREKEQRIERERKNREHRDRATNPRDVSSPSALVYVKDMIGQTVVNSEGKEIGRISELIVDPRNGHIQYGVLAVGRGFLGIGDKNIAIPWDDLHMSATQKGYLLDVDKDTLAKAPNFDRDHPKYDADRDRDERIVYRDRDVRREPLRDNQDSYVGRVESIDRDNNTVTIKKALISHKFIVDKDSDIPLKRVKVGEKVEVIYTTREDAKIAQHLYVLEDKDGNVRTKVE